MFIHISEAVSGPCIFGRIPYKSVSFSDFKSPKQDHSIIQYNLTHF